MEIREMMIEDIEKRVSEIKAEMQNADCNLDALTEEVEALEARKAEIVANAEQRKAELDAIAKDDTLKVEKTFEEERKKTMEIEVRNTNEYINAYAEYLKTNDATECRALLTDNASGTVAIPTVVEDIVRTAWDKEGIMSLVKKSYIKGNLKIGFEFSATGAVIHEEGTPAPAEETLVLGTVSLVPQSIKKWITISDEAMDLKGEAFLQYIYNELAYQIAKKAADTLVAKVVAGTTSGSTTAVPVAETKESTIALGTVANAIAKLSDEASNPVVIMNKATWANFKAVQYAGNYAVDPFEGLTVLFNNSLPSFNSASANDTYAIVGDLGAGAQANFPNGQEIKFVFDDKSLAEADLVKIVGREFVAIELVAPNAFCKIVK